MVGFSAGYLILFHIILQLYSQCADARSWPKFVKSSFVLEVICSQILKVTLTKLLRSFASIILRDNIYFGFAQDVITCILSECVQKLLIHLNDLICLYSML